MNEVNEVNNFSWNKLKNKDIPVAENILRGTEETCVSACNRFLNGSKTAVWMLQNKKKETRAIVINSRSTLMPVLYGLKKIPPLTFLNGLFTRKKIHSLQGLTEEVIVLEKEMQNMGKRAVEINDYDLMSLDYFYSTEKNRKICKLQNLIIRKPVLDDIEALLPLRKGYEEEEVLPKGSVFSPDAGRVVLANFIAYGKILVAELNGKIVGKVAVNAVSFTRYQIGGVFVLPEYRNCGIASIMTREFVRILASEGRGLTLFVNKKNIPALRLYDSIGFIKKFDYRITYY